MTDRAPAGGDRDDALAFTVSSVWREHRVSCPHPDLLRAYDAGSLESGAIEFLDFHLREAACPYCNAVLEDLRARADDASQRKLVDLKDRLMRSTAAALRPRPR